MFCPYLPSKRKVSFSEVLQKNKKSFPHIALARMYYTPPFHIQERKLSAEFPAKASRYKLIGSLHKSTFVAKGISQFDYFRPLLLEPITFLKATLKRGPY